MNRIDRLFAITTRLQARGRVRAVDLARIFEVSTRTIYRDIAALSESGVPIVSLPGEGYALSDGYFLPPLVLSIPEATALVLGARMLAGHASTEIAQAAEQAIAKIEAVVDDQTRQQIEEVDSVFDLALTPDSAQRLDLNDERICALRQAIQERRVASLRYFGRNRGAETLRQVEPVRLGYANGAWYLTAFCRLRAEERAFRLDRIEDLRLESERFKPRPLTNQVETAGVEVIAHFRGDAARWVRERQHWSYAGEIQIEDGPAFRYRPGHIGEIAPWLLGWGTAVEVLAPEELRERLRGEAQRVLQLLT
ncbi:MAG: helix-turn-helix transcriptional regulator [Thermomicrobiales bacterium]